MSCLDELSVACRWYVLRVKANFEWKAAFSLRARAFEVFLPVSRRVHRRSKQKIVQTPLLPGYVFCRFDRTSLTPVLSTPGVAYVLSRGNEPEAIDESELYALRVITREAERVDPWPTFAAGQRVRILGGPLCGIEGVVIREPSKTRLVISISLLHRSVVAEIDRAWVESVETALPVGRALDYYRAQSRLDVNGIN